MRRRLLLPLLCACLLAPPLAAKYLVKLMSGGLRVGALQGVLEGELEEFTEALRAAEQRKPRTIG